MKFTLINKEQNLLENAMEQVLINRGFSKNDITHYLNVTNKDLHDPILLSNISKGADLLTKHLLEKNNIIIIVDSDVDGFTSAAILYNYLHNIYDLSNVSFFFHKEKEHGLKDFVALGDYGECKLVICPDSATNDIEEHKILKDLGIDVLILDHHICTEKVENAILINNQTGIYPNKTLSGAGVVYQFCRYLDKINYTNFADDEIDLAAFGIISDVMNLKNFETRYIIEQGLKNVKNPFLYSMWEKNKFNLGNVLTPFGVAFYITPACNAVIRIGTPEEKYLLLMSMLRSQFNNLIPSTKRGHKGEEETVCEQTLRNCTNIKNKQTKLRDVATEYLDKIIVENELYNNKVLIIHIADEDKVPHAITGLIANQLMGKYQKPVLLLHLDADEETGELSFSGSGRNCGNTEFNNFRSFLEQSELVTFAAGHEAAFGVSLPFENFKKLNDYCNERLKNYNFEKSYLVDFCFNNQNIDSDFLLELCEYDDLWGTGISEPLIAITNLVITNNNITLMSPDKNPTIKITLGNNLSLIKFKSSIEEYESLKSKGFKKINLVGKCNKNEWNGKVSAQVLITEYEIIDENDYYF